MLRRSVGAVASKGRKARCPINPVASYLALRPAQGESESRGLSTFDGTRQLNLGDLQHSKIMTTHSACLRERRRAAALVNLVKRAAGLLSSPCLINTLREEDAIPARKTADCIS
jgi:hypothetical protein